VMIIVHDLSGTPVSMSFHSSHTPAMGAEIHRATVAERMTPLLLAERGERHSYVCFWG
jgi:hypothetical protein